MILNLLRRANNLLEAAVGFTLVAFGGLMVLLLTIQVVGRYLFSYSAIWLVEGGQYSFVWCAVLGVLLAYRRRAHVALDYEWQVSSPWRRRITKTIVHVTSILFAACLLYGGVQLVWRFGNTYMPGLGWSMSLVYVSAVVAGAVMILFSGEFLIADLLRSGDDEAADEPQKFTGSTV